MAGEKSVRKGRIILCTLGTWGDILPFLAIAQALRHRGYATTVLTNDNWRDVVVAAGADFHAIAEKDPPQSGRDDYQFFLDNTLPSFARSYDYVSRAVESTPELFLLYRANMLGMECAAEKLGLPHVKVALQPSAIKSFDRPPWPMTSFAQGPFKLVFKSVLIPALYLIAELARRYRSHTNAFRRARGLAPHQFGTLARRTEDATVVLAPAWFALPQDDWPANSHCVGFPFYLPDTGGAPVDGELEQFVATHGKPIVFTPGTGVTDTATFFEKAEDICRLAQLPGLFLSPAMKTLCKTWGQAPILTRGFVDMAYLMPMARVLVHHGGIGTTAQALRAGVPQIIVPDRFDQPDNAMRIASLGLGAAIMKDRYPAQSWAAIVRKLTSSEAMAAQLIRASRSIARDNAALRVIAVLERVMQNHYGSHPEAVRVPAVPEKGREIA